MNPVERLIRRADAAQRRRRGPAIVVAVIKKYGDDNGGILAASLAHSSFTALFPLLLILVTVLGLVAAGHPALREQVIAAVTRQFPLAGHDLAANVSQLRRSSLIGLIIGLLALAWGATGLAQAGLFTMAQVWNLPGPERPGYFPRLGRAFGFLGTLGLGVVVTTALSGLAAYEHLFFGAAVLLGAVNGAINAAMFIAVYRVLTPSAVASGNLVPGAVTGGLTWTLLQALGTYLARYLLHVNAVYGVFATVLGLLAWIYLGVQIVMYTAEMNVVLARKLWPRSIAAPPLTDADRTVLADQALQNQRREDQRVRVSFSDSSKARRAGRKRS